MAKLETGLLVAALVGECVLAKMLIVSNNKLANAAYRCQTCQSYYESLMGYRYYEEKAAYDERWRRFREDK